MKKREQENVVDQAECKQTPKARDASLAPLGAGAEALLAPLSHSPQQSLLQSARTKQFTGSLHQFCLPCCSSFWPSGERFYSLCSHLFALPETLIQPSKLNYMTETFQFLSISLD